MESDRPKINASTSLYVGEEVKSSWSLWERMRRTGREYWWVERSGGEGKGGVVGVGSRAGADWDGWRLDRNSDNFFDRSTLPRGGNVADAMLGERMREESQNNHFSSTRSETTSGTPPAISSHDLIGTSAVEHVI